MLVHRHHQPIAAFSVNASCLTVRPPLIARSVWGVGTRHVAEIWKVGGPMAMMLMCLAKWANLAMGTLGRSTTLYHRRRSSLPVVSGQSRETSKGTVGHLVFSEDGPEWKKPEDDRNRSADIDKYVTRFMYHLKSNVCNNTSRLLLRTLDFETCLLI